VKINNKAAKSHKDSMQRIRSALVQSIPVGTEFILVVYDGPKIVNRQLSFITSGDGDEAREILQDWINKTQ